MRKILWLTGLALAIHTATAGAVGIGVEPFGGLSVPVLQDDREQGGTWGIRVPVAVVPLITLEPFYASASYGDKTVQTIAGPQTRDGGKVSAWGANLLLTAGSPAFKFYPFVGIGSSTDKRVTGEISRTAYGFGLGVGVGLPMKLGLDARGELQMGVEGEVSRKFAGATLGLSYQFLSLP